MALESINKIKRPLKISMVVDGERMTMEVNGKAMLEVEFKLVVGLLKLFKRPMASAGERYG